MQAGSRDTDSKDTDSPLGSPLGSPHIVSINIATRSQITAGNKELETGIFKRPCDGPVEIGEWGLEGDCIADTNVHGGTDQAVYLYSMADYRWWSGQLGRELEPGCFGENLTLSSFPEQPLRIGDRLRINGDIHLEITAPRVPCLKLAARMDDSGFVKKFIAAVRPGAYARVLSGGAVSSGDPVRWEPTAEDYVQVNEVFIEWHKKDWSAELFQRALQAPISDISRKIIEKRYTR